LDESQVVNPSRTFSESRGWRKKNSVVMTAPKKKKMLTSNNGYKGLWAAVKKAASEHGITPVDQRNVREKRKRIHLPSKKIHPQLTKINSPAE